MADDNTDPYTQIWGDMGGPLNPAFQDFSSNMSTDDIFSKQWLGQALGGTIAAAQKTAREFKPITAEKTPYAQYFAHAATIGNYEKGHIGIGMEPTQRPGRTAPARAENPQEVYARWHDNMRRFAYGS